MTQPAPSSHIPGLLPTGDPQCSCGCPSCATCFALHQEDMDDFTRQYIETALWSSNDESTPNGGEPIDTNYSIKDIEPDAIRNIIETCASFQKDHADLLAQAYQHPGYTAFSAGHDFWLTRNSHGAGFWDRGLGEVGAALTAAAKDCGNIDLYVTDTGSVSLSNMDGVMLPPSAVQQAWALIAPTLRQRLSEQMQTAQQGAHPDHILEIVESTPFNTPGALTSEDCCMALNASDRKGRWLAVCQARFVEDEEEGGLRLLAEVDTAEEAAEGGGPRFFKIAITTAQTPDADAKAALQQAASDMEFGFAVFVEACQSDTVQTAAKTLSDYSSPSP